MKKNVVKIKVCQKCNNKFNPRTNRAIWCDDCYILTCEWCNEIFIDRRASRRAIRFCSLTCANLWQDSPQAKEEARQRTIKKRGNGVTKRCPTCNSLFYAPGWLIAKKGGKYCSKKCRDYKADASNAHFHKVLETLANGKPTSLEIAGRKLLGQMGISFLEQQIIGGKFVIDVLIPDDRIIIQWDGDFWHGNPAIYTEFNKIQQINKNRDKRCDAYLKKCGYRVLRFWERDVHSSPSKVCSEIISALDNSDKT